MTAAKSKTDYLFLLSLVMVWVLFHYRVIFLGETFVKEDASGFFYPLWSYGASVFQQGLIPLWNPQTAFGTPYLADPEMVGWYPPARLVYAFLKPVNAFNVMLLGHHLFGMVGLWVLARSRMVSAVASLAGALVYGFSIHAVGLLSDPAVLFSFSWIAWVFWLADQPTDNVRGYILGLSLVLAMQLASGYPLIFYLTLLVLTLRIFWEAVVRRNRQVLDRGILALAGLVLALLFNLAWMIPFEEFRGLSNIPFRLGLSQSLPVNLFWTWLNPFCASRLQLNELVPFFFSCFYLGLPSVVVIAWATLKGKLRLPGLFLFLLIMILSLGNTTPLGEWVRSVVPFYGWVARSGYWMSLIIFGAAILTAEAFDALTRAEDKKDMVFIGLSVLIFGLAFSTDIRIGLGEIVAAFLLLCAAGLSALPGWIRWMCFVFSILASVIPMDQASHFTLPRAYYEKSPVVLNAMMKPGRLYQSPQFVDSFQVSPGQTVQESLNNLKDNLIPNGPLSYDRETVCFKNSFYLNSFLRWYRLSAQVDDSALKKLLSYWNVEYVLGKEVPDGFKTLGISDLSKLSENPGPLPKWFSVSETTAQADWATDANQIKNHQVELTRQSWVADSALAGRYFNRQVFEMFRGSGMISLEAKGSGRALLVSSETAYPGWRAQTNRGPGLVVEVNQGFRGLILEDGQDKVTLVYSPTSFRIGCFLSLLVTAVWACFALSLIKSKRLINDIS